MHSESTHLPPGVSVVELVIISSSEVFWKLFLDLFICHSLTHTLNKIVRQFDTTNIHKSPSTGESPAFTTMCTVQKLSQYIQHQFH